MCDRCVAAGKMTQAEADEQRDTFAALLGAGESGPSLISEILGEMAMSPEDMMMLDMLRKEESGRVILGKMVELAFRAGWGLAVVRNGNTGEFALGFVHGDNGTGAIALGIITEETARVIEKEMGR